MASSNRHWPSMFKSKPCNPHHHHQWQHDINPSSLVSTGCHRSTPPCPSAPGCEERCTPEPKPRWNPKPEQIRILEAIFNSGMVNPPREEIRKIRAQLQEYGQVGDANVFYWFQNRKSRSKHKPRLPQNTKQQQNSPQQTHQTTPPITSLSKTPLTAPSSSSSSSSEKSTPKLSKRTLSLTPPVSIIDLSSSPTGSVNQTYFQAHSDFVSEPFLIPAHQQTGAGGGTMGPFTQGFYFPDLSNVVQVQDHTVGPCTSLLLNEIMNSGALKKHHHEQKNTKMELLLDYTTSTPGTHSIGLAPLVPAPNTTTDSTIPVLPTLDHVQGLEDHSEGTVLGSGGGGSAATSTVFINDVAFEVGLGPFNVREAFGDDVALIHSSGQPVLTNEWGVTLHSLQHGAFYYLVPLPLSENI